MQQMPSGACRTRGRKGQMMSEANTTGTGPIQFGANDAAASVRVTDRAARRIGEILRSEPAGTMLRVSVEGGGCSGFQYRFDIERDKADDDVAIAGGGVTVLVDSVSMQFLAGSEIDFVDDLIGASFKVNNPQAKASCGCGTSFSL